MNAKGYIVTLFLFVVAVAIILSGAVFSFFVEEKTPGIYDPNVKYIPNPLPKSSATNNLQIIEQTYKKVILKPSPPPGGTYCDPAFLAKYFSPEAMKYASCICNAESGGTPFATNYSCMNKGDPLCLSDPLCKGAQYGGSHATPEYSVGLFQSNIISKGRYSSDNRDYCPDGFSGTQFACGLKNTGIFNYCVGDPNAGYFNPSAMAAWAASLYNSESKKWSDWACSAYKCGVPNFPVCKF